MWIISKLSILKTQIHHNLRLFRYLKIHTYCWPAPNLRLKQTRETRFWHLKVPKKTLGDFSEGAHRTYPLFASETYRIPTGNETLKSERNCTLITKSVPLGYRQLQTCFLVTRRSLPKLKPVFSSSTGSKKVWYNFSVETEKYFLKRMRKSENGELRI